MIKHIRINPLFFAVVILAYWMGNLSAFMVTYLALLLHEGIHLWFLEKEQIPVREITIEPFGISIRTQQKMPENSRVYLSAPIGNLIISVVFMLGNKYVTLPFSSQWILSNLSLGFVNLLPILPLDGGRALLLYLEKHMEKESAKKKVQFLSAIVWIPVLLGCMFLMFQEGGNLSIIIVLIFLCYTFLSGNRLYEYQTMKKSVFRTEKGCFQETVFVEHLGVPWNYPAKKLLKKFRGEKYYVVDIFRDGILIKTVTETQILNRILATNHNLNVSEC